MEVADNLGFRLVADQENQRIPLAPWVPTAIWIIFLGLATINTEEPVAGEAVAINQEHGKTHFSLFRYAAQRNSVLVQLYDFP